MWLVLIKDNKKRMQRWYFDRMFWSCRKYLSNLQRIWEEITFSWKIDSTETVIDLNKLIMLLF